MLAALLLPWALLLAMPAAADITVDVRGLDDELQRNVLAFLSLERYKERDRLQTDVLERLLERVERETKAALRPYGYYEPTVKSKLEGASNGRDWRVRIDVEPGRPVVLQDISVRVTGPGADQRVFQRITENLPLRRGARLNHADYEQVKGDLQRTAATFGYLDAKLLRSELAVDPPNRVASVYLELDTGVRYVFGRTNIEQNVINETLVRRYLRYGESQPFNANELLRTQFALDDSQYFSTVEVLPGEIDRERRVVPIDIRGQANRRNRWQFGVGYGTDTLTRGTVAWENRLVNRRGHRLRVDLRAASKEQSLESRYIVPIGDPALEKLTFELSGTREQLEDLDITEVVVEPSITQVLGRWQRVFFVSATATTTESPNVTQRDQLLIPGVSYASVPRGYLGEALFTRAFYAELRGSQSALGSNSDFLQLRMQAERVFDLAPRWHLIVRGEFGGTAVSNTSQLPGSQRFFAGGDRSVRGFAVNDLSPSEPQLDASGNPVRDANGNPVQIKTGARQLLVGSAEVERDIGKTFGVAAFFDVGRAFNEYGDPLDYEHGFGYAVGLGFRVRLPVVTLGIDVAQEISGANLGPRLHLNFSPKL